MPPEPKRKLAAIMFTDMVGYTSLMQKDEDKARELIERHRDLMKPHVDKHGGKIIQYVGDGTFCRFDSAKEAVNAALEIQHVFELEDDMSLRIGIHVGDVVVKGDEVYGYGVNIASRLEPLAEAGGICVSMRVRDDIKNQSRLSLSSLGKKDLKNVDEAMEVFTVTKSSESSAVTSDIPIPTPASSKLNMKWIGVAAVITALVIIGTKIDFGTMEVESKEEANSLRIAVLPFENMSSDPENEFFTDGITEDILAQISKIKSLEVISRTSIMQYKNTTKSLRQIGKELGVATILEGSVRRGGNRVRIVAQLIDTETDKHLWTETYDRDLDDIFAIQSDVAANIAVALKTTLTPEEELNINRKPTESVEAYDFYLKGNDYFNRSYDEDDFRIAIQMYQRSIDLDPDFALAHAQLSRSNSLLYWFHYDRSEERLLQAKASADKALNLNDELPEANLALGYYYYWGLLDYETALSYFALVKKQQPNNSVLLSGIGFVQRRQGKMNLALENLMKAFESDPRSSHLAQNIATTYTLVRNYPEAEEYLNRTILFSPDRTYAYFWKALLYLKWKGNPTEARAVIENAMQTVNIEEHELIAYARVVIELYDKNYQTALDLLLSYNHEIFDSEYYFIHKSQLLAHVYGLMNQPILEQSHYDIAREFLEAKSKKSPNDPRLHSALGLVYAGIGLKELSISEGKKGIDILPISKEAWRGTYRLEDLAQIYAIVGEHKAAINHLETLLNIPSDMSQNLLRLDPKWDPLREHPRFIKLVDN